MTSRELAKLLGVSQATVSRALNDSDLVPEEKRKQIQRKAKEYGFVFNSHAKSLRTRRTDTIGILFPTHFVGMTENMMLAHLYDSIQRELHKQNYDIMVIYYSAEEDDFSSFERIVRMQKVDGFLVLRMGLTQKEMELIEEYQVPCVFLLNAGTKIPPNLNYLFSDSRYGGVLAGRYLGGFPAYRKYFVTIREQRADAGRRLEGYREGLRARGYALREEDILSCELSIESAYDCIMGCRERFIGEKTAFFTYNDPLGLGVVGACQQLGLEIPDQVQVISMDDIPLARAIRPRLSTLHVAVEEMVPRGCGLLVNLIRRTPGPLVREWLKPSLILRETTL